MDVPQGAKGKSKEGKGGPKVLRKFAEVVGFMVSDQSLLGVRVGEAEIEMRTGSENDRRRFRLASRFFAGPWEGQQWQRPALVVLILALALEALLALGGEKQRVLPTMDMPFLPRREAGLHRQRLVSLWLGGAGPSGR